MSSKINIINTTNSVTITPLSTNNVDTNIINTPVTVTQGGANRVEILNDAKIGDSITLTNITASGDISASGNITVGNIELGKLNPSIIEIEHDHNSSNLAGIAFVQGPNPPHNDIGFIRHRESGDNGRMEFVTSDNGNGYGSDHFIFGASRGGTNIINMAVRPWFKIQGDYQNRPTAIISGALELITGYSGTPGNIKASGDVLATNISASGELKVDNPSYAGNLRIYQQSTNKYRLTSNIGTALEIGPDNVLRTAQRIQGTRGMFVKTLAQSDNIIFSDYDNNNIIRVTHTGSLILGNPSAQNPSVIINTDITASGDISASNDIHAQNFILSTDSSNPGKLAGSNNSSNKFFQLEDGGGRARLGVYRGFRIFTNEGETSQKADFGLDRVKIMNADFSVDGHITASGNISASGDISGSALHIKGTARNFIQGDAGFRLAGDNNNVFLENDGRTLTWQANNSARLQINSHDGGNNDSYIWFSHSENNDIKNVSAGTSQASGSFIIARDEGFGTNLDFVITGSNGFIGINEPNPTERLSVKGSIIASGSVRTTVVDITPPITTTTASLDCSLSNIFTLTLSSSNNIYLTSSNIAPGQSISLRITQPATSGSLTYDSTFKFPNGAPYEVSATHSVEDIVSFISFDSTTLYGSSLKNFE